LWAASILMIGRFVKCGECFVHHILLVRRTVDYCPVRDQTGCGEVLHPMGLVPGRFLHITTPPTSECGEPLMANTPR
jgi:hypothetical protein